VLKLCEGELGRFLSGAVWLVAGGSAVITHHKAGDVHRLEVGQGETGNAGKIVIVPASVGRADEAAAVSVIGEDDAIVSECGDDNGRLWTGGGTGGGYD
jgi:hypothetical protein